jgi:hypothetical protein
MEVRDHDPPNGTAQLGKDAAPPFDGVGNPEARVDDRPPALRRRQEIAVHVVDPERQREGHTSDSAVELDHSLL